MSDSSYDIAVVGAGVIGAAIAAQLSQRDVRVVWLEAAHDVAERASKANSAIAGCGYDLPPGSLESQLIRESSPQWEEICRRLDVPFRRIGALSLAFDDVDADALGRLGEQAAAAEVAAELVSGDRLRRLTGPAAPDARQGLHVPAEAIIDPIRLTVGYAKLAVTNGVELRTSTPVIGLRRGRASEITHVVTPGGSIAVGAVVNAAGVNGDRLAAAVDERTFTTWPRKGQFLLLDRAVGHLVPKILCTAPTEHTRGIYAVPTTNGSVLVGPSAVDGTDREDRSTDAETLEAIWARAARLLPGIERHHVTRTFAGLRPASDRPYRIGISMQAPNLMHAVGIRSTGISSAPGVAAHVVGRLADDVIELPAKARARSSIPALPRLAEMSDAEVIRQFAASCPDRPEEFPLIVCACEHVTAAEIAAECRGPVPATSLDGVRKRTRAMSGRCQGAYCSVGVGFILSVARGCRPGEVRQGEPGSQWEMGSDG